MLDSFSCLHSNTHRQVFINTVYDMSCNPNCLWHGSNDTFWKIHKSLRSEYGWIMTKFFPLCGKVCYRPTFFCYRLYDLKPYFWLFKELITRPGCKILYLVCRISLLSIETVWKRQIIWYFLFRTGGKTEFFPYQSVLSDLMEMQKALVKLRFGGLCTIHALSFIHMRHILKIP